MSSRRCNLRRASTPDQSREAAEYLSPGREPWIRWPSPRPRHPSPARAGEGKGKREGAATHGSTPWAKLCRSFGAELRCELRLRTLG